MISASTLHRFIVNLTALQLGACLSQICGTPKPVEIERVTIVGSTPSTDCPACRCAEPDPCPPIECFATCAAFRAYADRCGCGHASLIYGGSDGRD